MLFATSLVALILCFSSCTNEDLPEATEYEGCYVFNTRGEESGSAGTELVYEVTVGNLGPDKRITIYQETLDPEGKFPQEGTKVIYYQLPPQVDETWEVRVHGNFNTLFKDDANGIPGYYQWYMVTWRKADGSHSGSSMDRK